MKTQECPTCGAKMVEYKQGLSKGLAASLRKISNNLSAGNKFHISQCGLTYSQRENCRKLQYWGVIEKLGDKDSKGGWWRLTNVGRAFIEGRVLLRKFVWTYRGDFVRFDGPRLAITDLSDGWKYRPDYARESRPHDPYQSGLFT